MELFEGAALAAVQREGLLKFVGKPRAEFDHGSERRSEIQDGLLGAVLAIRGDTELLESAPILGSGEPVACGADGVGIAIFQTGNIAGVWRGQILGLGRPVVMPHAEMLQQDFPARG